MKTKPKKNIADILRFFSTTQDKFNEMYPSLTPPINILKKCIAFNLRNKASVFTDGFHATFESTSQL